MDVTKGVSKFVKSIDFKFLHPAKSLCIFVADEVSIFNKFNDSRLSQPKNRYEKSVIFDVLKNDISIETNFLQL